MTVVLELKQSICANCLTCERVAYATDLRTARNWAERHYEAKGHQSQIINVQIEPWPGEA